jgi:fido (protein-threonine AMPylation protein)
MAYGLDFSIENQPKWRDSDQPTTDVMLSEIVSFRKQFEALPESGKQFCKESFSRAMAVEFIYHSNSGDSVSSQTWRGTEEIVESLLEKEGKDGKEAIRIKNIHKAMAQFFAIFNDEMKGILTVQQICDVHKILMKGLHRNAGEIRVADAFTYWNGELHRYPEPEKVEDLFYAVIDHHTLYINGLSKITKGTQEEIEYVFKSAARLLYDFVDTVHPFGNGNGRMCRLLANYVLYLVTPFPVSLYHADTNNKKRSGREDYINAIVQCRYNRDEGPRDIAAMLVEGAWWGWKAFFKNWEVSQFSGVVVVKASKLGEVAEKVHTMLDRKTMSLDEKNVTELITKAVEEIDGEKLQDFRYLELAVEVAPKTLIMLHVFK